MDLNTDLPGTPDTASRNEGVAGSGVHCDGNPTLRDSPLTAEQANDNAFGWICPYDRGTGNAFEDAACTRDMAAVERDRFLDGCLKIQEDERLRLGRELHDSTGQLLLALRLNVAQLKRVHGSPIEDELLDEIEDTARRIDQEIRSFAFLTYPPEIGREGLCESLRSLTRGFAVRTGLRFSFACQCESAEVDGPRGIALLRVAQEALMNVYRHAHAIHVRVSLTLRGRLLELVIRDDGIGVPSYGDIAKSHGVGLLGMRHRMERLGGHFDIKRMKHGTKLIASVPLG
jgi:signal transduction histidine kinase